MAYLISGGVWHCEEDHFYQGCLPDTCQSTAFEIEIKGDTLKEALNRLYELTNSKKSECLFNSCDDIGRIDIQWSSLAPFSYSRVSGGKVKQFNLGKIHFFSNTLIVNAEKTEDVNFWDEYGFENKT